MMFPVECFGKSLRVELPAGTKGGDVLYLYLNDNKLSATVSTIVQGVAKPVGPARVEEVLVA